MATFKRLKAFGFYGGIAGALGVTAALVFGAPLAVTISLAAVTILSAQTLVASMAVEYRSHGSVYHAFANDSTEGTVSNKKLAGAQVANKFQKSAGKVKYTKDGAPVVMPKNGPPVN